MTLRILHGTRSTPISVVRLGAGVYVEEGTDGIHELTTTPTTYGGQTEGELAGVAETTDHDVLWSGGVGVAMELAGVANGRLALQYSTDSTTWAFLDADVADEGPFVELNATGDRKSAWLEPDAAVLTDVVLRAVTVTSGGTVAEIDGAERIWRYCGGIKRIRVGCYVTTAGNLSTDPVIRNIWMETAAFGTVASPPPDPEPTEGEVASSCDPSDTYPVSRGLIAWHLADCGSFTFVAGIQDKVNSLTDLSGNSNTLNPTGVADISGAIVTRGTTSGGTTIPALNSRQPISFKDAWLPWPTTLFTGMTEGELWIVVRGFQTDPTTDRKYSWTLGTHTGSGNQPVWGEGSGAAGTGVVKEDFGSSALRNLGDPSGVTLTDWHVYRVSAGSGVFEAYIDGTLIFSDSSNTPAFSTAPKMGSRSENSQILIAEIAIHNAVLTPTEAASVLAALQARWAL